MSVPRVPEMVWNRNGIPNFAHLEATQEERSILAQLQTLVDEDYEHTLNPEAGDFTKVRELYPDSLIYEVHQHGGTTIYRRGYVVENGRAHLDDEVEPVVPEQYRILSRRKISKVGVPELPRGHYEGAGADRRFILNEED